MLKEDFEDELRRKIFEAVRSRKDGERTLVQAFMDGTDPLIAEIASLHAQVQALQQQEIDATGRCTVRELVLEMITSHKGDTCELAFPLPDGRRVNVEVRITRLERES